MNDLKMDNNQKTYVFNLKGVGLRVNQLQIKGKPAKKTWDCRKRIDFKLGSHTPANIQRQ